MPAPLPVSVVYARGLSENRSGRLTGSVDAGNNPHGTVCWRASASSDASRVSWVTRWSDDRARTAYCTEDFLKRSTAQVRMSATSPAPSDWPSWPYEIRSKSGFLPVARAARTGLPRWFGSGRRRAERCRGPWRTLRFGRVRHSDFDFPNKEKYFGPT
jgi:hypothetical protein